MLGLHDVPGLHYLQVSFPAAAAADATATLAVVVMPFKAKVKWAKVTSGAGVTGNGTNSQNWNVKKVIAGSATEIAALDLALGTDLVALTPTRIGGADLAVALSEGDLVILEREKVGDGAALTAGLFIVAITGG